MNVQKEIDRELRRAGHCTQKCKPHLGPWTEYPECFILVTEHAGKLVPFSIERLPGEQSPQFATTFQALLRSFAERAKTWHAAPGSEDEWRDRLKSAPPSFADASLS